MAPKLKRPSGSKSSAPKRVKKAPATQLGQGLQRQELKVFDTALAFNLMQLRKYLQQGNSVSFNRRHLEQQRRRSRRSEVSSNKGNDHVHPSSCSNGSSSGDLVCDARQTSQRSSTRSDGCVTGTNMNNDLPNVPNQYRFKNRTKTSVRNDFSCRSHNCFQ